MVGRAIVRNSRANRCYLMASLLAGTSWRVARKIPRIQPWNSYFCGADVSTETFSIFPYRNAAWKTICSFSNASAARVRITQVLWIGIFSGRNFRWTSMLRGTPDFRFDRLSECGNKFWKCNVISVKWFFFGNLLNRSYCETKTIIEVVHLCLNIFRHGNSSVWHLKTTREWYDNSTFLDFLSI